MKQSDVLVLLVVGFCRLALSRPLAAVGEDSAAALPTMLVTSDVLESNIAQVEAAALSFILQYTLWLIVGLILVHALSIPWLLVVRRRLAYEAAMERRQASLAASQATELDAGGEEDSTLQFEEPEVDLGALSDESRELVKIATIASGLVGLYLIWSLSDQTTRIILSVGIAYGSDVRQAMRLLEEAARENENVLDDPPPSVIFEAFGDNSLAMALRCFVDSAELRYPTISTLNEAINDKFNAAGIVIAFPQRDLHLDNDPPAAGGAAERDERLPGQGCGGSWGQVAATYT